MGKLFWTSQKLSISTVGLGRSGRKKQQCFQVTEDSIRELQSNSLLGVCFEMVSMSDYLEKMWKEGLSRTVTRCCMNRRIVISIIVLNTDHSVMLKELKQNLLFATAISRRTVFWDLNSDIPWKIQMHWLYKRRNSEISQTVHKSYLISFSVPVSLSGAVKLGLWF